MALMLITGAAKRIGKAMAIGMAKDGWTIAVHYRNSQKDAEDVVSTIRSGGGQAFSVQTDLFDRDQSQLLVSQCAKIGKEPVSCLINNASLYEKDEFETVTNDSWDRHMEINLHAPFLLSQSFVQNLPNGYNGNIINVIDQRVLKLNPQFMSYTLSKSGLWTLTKTMAQALAPDTRVNAIGPGPTLASIHQDDEIFSNEQKKVPLMQGPSLDEFVSTIKYILNSPSMTGQMICLDGGQHLSWKTPDIKV